MVTIHEFKRFSIPFPGEYIINFPVIIIIKCLEIKSRTDYVVFQQILS